MNRPTRALINLDALQHNYRLAQSQAPGSRTLAVVKADGYGHGAVAVANALAGLAPALAVSCAEEAMVLRQGGIDLPILLLTGPYETREVTLASEQNFWLMVESDAQVRRVTDARLRSPVTVWLKVDTGMHRLGLAPEELTTAREALVASGNVRNDMVIATHLACADELDNPMTRRQVQQLQALTAGWGAPLSIANSPGLLAWPEARAEWNRPGFMLYGNSPFTRPHTEADKLRPVMTFESRVMSLRTVPPGDGVGYGGDWRARRPSLIATVPAGYGDGYPRTARSGTPVLVNGQRAPLAGRVSMDLLGVDVTDIEGVEVGSSVELWGENLGVNEVAAGAGTIGYELLARMPGRVPRLYTGHR